MSFHYAEWHRLPAPLLTFLPPILGLFHPCPALLLPVTQTQIWPLIALGSLAMAMKEDTGQTFRAAAAGGKKHPFAVSHDLSPWLKKFISSQHELSWSHYRHRIRVI